MTTWNSYSFIWHFLLFSYHIFTERDLIPGLIYCQKFLIDWFDLVAHTFFSKIFWRNQFLSKAARLQLLRFYDFVDQMTILHPLSMKDNCMNGFDIVDKPLGLLIKIRKYSSCNLIKFSSKLIWPSKSVPFESCKLKLFEILWFRI